MINRNISLELPRETTSFTHDDGNQWDDENDKDVDDDNDDHNDDEAEVEFVSAVSAGGSVKFLPAV